MFARVSVQFCLLAKGGLVNSVSKLKTKHGEKKNPKGMKM